MSENDKFVSKHICMRIEFAQMNMSSLTRRSNVEIIIQPYRAFNNQNITLIIKFQIIY